MTGFELHALRDRLSISASALAREIGTSETAIKHVEIRKSVSVTTASRYVVAAFTVAKRDVEKREALAAELADTSRRLQQAASALTSS
jgi:predicted transcriptional regulator